jgi:transmembrane sensor
MTRSNSMINTQILEEASDWFVELNEQDLDATARAHFDGWLRRSPEHVQAYLKVTALWENLSLLDRGRTLSANDLVSRVRQEGNIHPLQAARKPPPEPPDSADTTARNVLTLPTAKVSTPPAGGPTRHGPRFRVVLAACITLAVVGISPWLFSQRDTYSTRIGEQRSFGLEDGSTITLNSHSRVRIRYGEAERSVELLEGQALFRVAKDAARPFVVHTDSTSVRAVGTQFDVYKRHNGTTVTVLEGRVAVLTQPLDLGPTEPGTARPAPEPALLGAGEQLTIAPAAPPEEPHRADATAATAWTQHKIVFQRTPLSEVVDEFNLYNSRTLVITDETLAEIRITGVFSSTDPNSLLRFLRELPDVDVRETPADIRITRK